MTPKALTAGVVAAIGFCVSQSAWCAEPPTSSATDKAAVTDKSTAVEAKKSRKNEETKVQQKRETRTGEKIPPRSETPQLNGKPTYTTLPKPATTDTSR